MDQIEMGELAEIATSLDQEGAWLVALYERGDVEDKKDEEWLKTAAEMGIAPAMCAYAEMLDLADRVEESERWYLAAANGGSPAAMYEMGLIYDERREFHEREVFYRRAAQKGYLPAMHDLARLLSARGEPEWLLWAAMCEEAGYEPWDAGLLA